MNRMFRKSYFAALLLLVFLTSESFAQTPQFKLDVTLSRGSFKRIITFGYDPGATKGADASFGEDSDYPPLFGEDFVLLNSDSSFLNRDGASGMGVTKTDIRHKPDSASFTIGYEWEMILESYPATISWDPSAIPAIVHHVILQNVNDLKHPLADMKTQSSLTVTSDNRINFHDVYMTLYYNSEPAAVHSAGAVGTGLLSDLSATPNPFTVNSRINFTLRKEASISIVAYDAAGREVFTQSSIGHAGSNVIALDRSTMTSASGPLFVRVSAMSAAEQNVRTLTLIAQ